ncbi:alpha-tocopherol transfer protein-like [Malaya genurostris]|uniref:alpha-tocopherol transfer protein-like n=1 Tax=Malaya genurostris TaxID=325434 RepID=UPI0026F3FE56|nr:alpha-tocopherol transfer protein-like [Malaya genurostris]XP_058467323.1 alpha-tocopherol transfer protein-like [Malaya genurostris]
MKYTKAISPPDEYVFRFSEELRKVAEEELGETDDRREHALAILRDWAEKNPRIAKIRMDAVFLLKFLRAKKFCIPVVQENIERFLLLRHTKDELLFKNLDCHQPNLSKLLDLGFMFALPKRDRNGRRVIFYRPGVFDMNQFTNGDMLRVASICVETLLADEENQIRGVVHAGVGTGIGLQYLTLFTIKEAVRLAKNGERLVPMRHREMHGCNINPALKIAVDWGLSLISEKLRNRVRLYTDIKDIQMDKSLLPKEYGGVMPAVEMIKLWKEEVEAYRSTLLKDDEMAVHLYMYSEAARNGSVSALKQSLNGCSAASGDNSTYGLAGSFRKLEVD